MTSKPASSTGQGKTEPSEAGHNRNTPGDSKGLAETSVNEPHIEKTDTIPEGERKA